MEGQEKMKRLLNLLMTLAMARVASEARTFGVEVRGPSCEKGRSQRRGLASDSGARIKEEPQTPKAGVCATLAHQR
jgi:hypothetical protein